MATADDLSCDMNSSEIFGCIDELPQTIIQMQTMKMEVVVIREHFNLGR